MLISAAYAQAPAAAPAAGPNMMIQMVMIGGMFALMYFLFFRPQMKKAKEHRAMIDQLAKGNEVVAAGGILGKIVKLDDNFATLQVGENTQIIVQRGAIVTLLPPGTIKSI